MLMSLLCFFFKQKTAYEMRISDWSSDVCSSDLQKALKHGEAEKRYFALLLGKWRGEDREVDAALVKRSLAGDRRVQVDEEDGKPSKSLFSPKNRYRDATFCEVQIFTGRTHQIRVHELGRASGRERGWKNV